MMSKQIMIAISREYGSGGHRIAEELAKKLNLPLYDRNLLDEIAEKKVYNKQYLEHFDESVQNPFTKRTVRGISNSHEDDVAQIQFQFLREKAESGESFVVVGRCSDYILKPYEGLVSIFVSADMEFKIRRVEEHRGQDRKTAIKTIRKHEKARKFYHNTYCETRWGSLKGYDLCINSGKLGVDQTIDILQKYVEARMQA